MESGFSLSNSVSLSHLIYVVFILVCKLYYVHFIHTFEVTSHANTTHSAFALQAWPIAASDCVGPCLCDQLNAKDADMEKA